MESARNHRPQAVEPRLQGEHGYADWCLRLIEAGHCTCDGCGGHLVDEVCLSCGCRHYVQEANRFHARLPAWIPVYQRGRCSAADARAAELQGEHDQMERRRREE